MGMAFIWILLLILLWVAAVTCYRHTAEKQNQANASPPPLCFLSQGVPRTQIEHSTVSRALSVWFPLQLSEQLLMVATSLLLLDFFTAAAEIAAFLDLLTKQFESNSSTSCWAGDPQSLRTLQKDINIESFFLCPYSKLTRHECFPGRPFYDGKCLKPS